VTRAALARVLARSGFNRAFGFRVEAARPGACTLRAPVRRGLERPGGIVAGPVLMAAADAAVWLAILARLGAADGSVTVDMQTAFVSALRRGGFRCRARILRWGRRLIHGVAECRAPGGRLLSHHTVTYLRVEAAPAAGQSRRRPR
jgi:acyl-coenzyme A thioesterase PaaI-like protein